MSEAVSEAMSEAMSEAVPCEEDGDALVFACPHCRLLVLVHKADVNCAIFRHAAYKGTGAQIPPHAPQSLCEDVVRMGAVDGCALPFRLVQRANAWVAETCDYV